MATGSASCALIWIAARDICTPFLPGTSGCRRRFGCVGSGWRLHGGSWSAGRRRTRWRWNLGFPHLIISVGSFCCFIGLARGSFSGSGGERVRERGLRIGGEDGTSTIRPRWCGGVQDKGRNENCGPFESGVGHRQRF